MATWRHRTTQALIFVLAAAAAFVAHQYMMAAYHQHCNRNLLTALLYRNSNFCQGLNLMTNLIEGKVASSLHGLGALLPTAAGGSGFLR